MNNNATTPIALQAAAQLELRRRASNGDVVGSYEAFKRKYRNDPVGFAHECLRWEKDEGPVFYQDEIMTNLVERGRESVRGPHGLGKTSLAAWVVLWFALTRDGEDWKIATTASAWRQLTKFLWPEIDKWSRRVRWEVVGRGPFKERQELLALSLKLSTGEAFAMASDNAALIEGAHADHLLYIFDESKEIQVGTWDAAEGAFSTMGEVLWLAISTPGEPSGRFYEIQSRRPGYEDWHVRAVTLDEAIKARRVDQTWAENRRRQWGETSTVYLNRVLGEFAASDEDGIVPLSWIEAANERWQEWAENDRPGRMTQIGADVAWTGEDKTIFATRYDLREDDIDRYPEVRARKVVGELRVYAKQDLMPTVGLLHGIMRAYPKSKVVVDAIGIGSGVYSRLLELVSVHRVLKFMASERSEKTDRSGELGFLNMRAQGWWYLREQLDPSFGATLALPPDDMLTGDLTAPKWKVGSNSRIQVESKEDIRKRLGRSPDYGDAVVMACADVAPISFPKPGVVRYA